jgi:hypothetical protein
MLLLTVLTAQLFMSYRIIAFARHMQDWGGKHARVKLWAMAGALGLGWVMCLAVCVANMVVFYVSRAAEDRRRRDGREGVWELTLVASHQLHAVARPDQPLGAHVSDHCCGHALRAFCECRARAARSWWFAQGRTDACS